MVILLYGPDSYRRQQKLNEIVKNYREKHSVLSVESFDLKDDEEFLRLKDFCGQESLFAAKKMAIVKNASELEAKNFDELKNFLKSHLKNENLFLILSQNEKLPSSFNFLLEKPAIHQEFENLDEAHLEFFISKEAKEKNINLTPMAAKTLAKIFQKDTWGLITELEKLSWFGQKIDVSDVEKSVVWFEEPNIYRFIDAVSKNKPLNQKIYALENLFLNEEEPAKIFNFFAASKFIDFEMLKKLADCDVSVKSGKIDYETALFNLVL
ncbi:hypothetical protein HZB05_00710 [Candidatus Wolfebacteria bacterium]|nr:hypothetical protein [Candidatus Wolfebacteria bacterium]